LAILAFATSVSAQTRPPQTPQKWAVVIGIGKYKDPGITRLPYAEADARAVYQFLIDPNGGGYPAGNVTLFIDEKATTVDLKSALGTKLPQKAAREDMVFVFFAGHGAVEADRSEPDGHAKYLVSHDARADDLSASAIPMMEIARYFGRLTADTVVFVLDSCYSGEGGRGIGSLPSGQRGPPLLSDYGLDRIASQGKGRAVLAAADTNEVAHETHELRHGLFTYYLLEGLRGRADTERKGYVTLDAAYQYLYDKVVRHALELNGKQHPKLIGERVGEIILAGRAGMDRTGSRPVVRHVPTGSLIISSATLGADIFLDDQLVGTIRAGGALHIGNLAIGTHRVRAEMAGYKSTERTVEVAANEQRNLPIILAPMIAGEGVASGGPSIDVTEPPAGASLRERETSVVVLVTDEAGISGVDVWMNGTLLHSELPSEDLTTNASISLSAVLRVGDNLIEVTARNKTGETRRASRAVARLPALVVESPPPASERFAVVIGVGGYDSQDIPRLAYADQDARSIYNFLVTTGGFKAENVQLLTDSAPVKPIYRHVMSALSERLKARKNDSVLIYWAGYGASGRQGREAFLVPRDFKPNRPRSGVSLDDDLRQVLDDIPVERVVLLVDASFGGSGKGRTLPIARNIRIAEDVLNRLGNAKGRVVIAASAPTEHALELPDVRGGLFTHYVLKALGGEADRDKNGAVTVRELYDYLAIRVAAHAKSLSLRQQPILKGDVGGDLPLIEPKVISTWT
jgi:uncharacterized caspase-like protein